METRARYILIGAFTILGFLGILAFFLWFARVELDRQFAYYDIRFSSVSGLGNASDVRFSGLPVGQVVDVRLSPERDGTILVRVEVAAETPVRADSIATIEAQGVTGVSFVGIDPGTPTAPLLVSNGEGDIPEITAGRSTLQTLSEDAPALLAEMLLVVQDIGNLLGGENRGRMERILVNVESASNTFAQTLQDFSKVAETVNSFAEDIGRFNETLQALTGEIGGMLETTDTTLISIREASDQAKTFLSGSTDALDAARGTIAQTESYIAGPLSETTEELRLTLLSLREQAESLGADAEVLMATLGTTGTTATARLEEARGTLQSIDALIARLDETAADVGNTMARIDGLIETEGAPLLGETRAMVAEATAAIGSVNAVIETDLPAIIADVRSATDTSAKVIAEVGESLRSAGGRIDDIAAQAQETLEGVSVTFSNANETLSSINAALETGDRALAAAERAFDGADRFLTEDISGLVEGLEGTINRLDAAIAEVSDDLPAISEDLRAASRSAAESFAALRALADEAAPGVADFTTRALPLYTRLAQETRTLIANLDRLTTQIERDPARFLLNRDIPEFRR